MSAGFDLNASYTLAKATSTVGTASDELTQNLLQDISDPFGSFQHGPSTRTDARHRMTVSAIVQAPYDIRVAPIFSYRSALPVTTLEGLDLNADGVNNDHTPMAYRYTGLDANGVATFEEAGACETVNCSRRAPFSQLNMRISRTFPLFGHVAHRSDRRGVQRVQREEPVDLDLDDETGQHRPACDLHAADGIRRRRGPGRAARRPARLPHYLLVCC